MKILALNFNNYIPKSSPIKHQYAQADTFKLSFNGYVDDAMDCSDIHCPVCNTKMLSEKDYKCLVEKGGQVNSTSEFMNLLREYNDYIPKNMREILNLSEDLSLYELLIFNGKRACYKHEKNIKFANEYLKNFAETLPLEEKEAVLSTLETVLPRETIYNYRQKIIPLVASLKISKEDKYNISKDIFPKIKNSYEYWSVFKIKDSDKLPVNELSKALVSRIFKNSCITKSNISKMQSIDENPNNEILLCSGCNKYSTSKTFLPQGALEQDGLKNFLSAYICDISYTLGSKNLTANIPYIKNLCNFISRISHQKIKFDEREYASMKKINYFASRHEAFVPINQVKTDIHCADCGSIMMPYPVNVQMKADLDKAVDLKDYVNIITKYEKYIGKYSGFIADTFLKIAKDNPDISEEKFVELLQKKVDKYSYKETDKALNVFIKERNYILKNKSIEELEQIDEILKRIYTYINSGKFNDFQYLKMLDEVLFDINITDKALTPVYSLCSKLKKIGYINSLVKPNELDALQDKNQFHTITFNIFKPDFATVDHLLARSKNGEATKNNLIGLCKACNNIAKGQKHVLSWFNNNPAIKYNFIKQLEDIDGMAKRGEIEGYDDWAKTIADNMYQLTRGKYDIRDKFSM